MGDDKVILVLDIDGTMMVSNLEHDEIDFTIGRHQPSKYWIPYNGGFEGMEPICFLIINPDNLAQLFNFAVEHNIEIMILTAGLWAEDAIKTILIDNLDISPETGDIIEKCRFLSSANTSHHFPEKTVVDIQITPKMERLQKFIELNPEYKDSHFVLVDDDQQHVESCHGNITGIHATTRTHVIDLISNMNPFFDVTFFYKTAIATLLEKCKVIQQRAAAKVLQSIPPTSPVKSPTKNHPPQQPAAEQESPSKRLRGRLFNNENDNAAVISETLFTDICGPAV